MRRYKTYPTFDPRWGYYRVTFQDKSSHKSPIKKVYKGIGRRTDGRPENLVVKVLGSIPASRNVCLREFSKARDISHLADVFNAQIIRPSTGGDGIKVNVPHVTQVKNLAAWNAHKSRPIGAEEWVLAEPELRGVFKVFIGKDGKCLVSEFSVKENAV